MSIKTVLGSLKHWQKVAIVAIGTVAVGSTVVVPSIKIAAAENGSSTEADRYFAKVVRNIDNRSSKLYAIDNMNREALLQKAKDGCNAFDNPLALAMFGGVEGVTNIAATKLQGQLGEHAKPIAKAMIQTSIASDCDSFETGEVQPQSQIIPETTPEPVVETIAYRPKEQGGYEPDGGTIATLRKFPGSVAFRTKNVLIYAPPTNIRSAPSMKASVQMVMRGKITGITNVRNGDWYFVLGKMYGGWIHKSQLKF
ncbi:hypothetical protein [Chroococcidiopsis sp.]|uniref:hypothetical protein n=1 Tax=Chroococcidiopsis sp. TaxID=3088168 RepID=UPI003F3AD65C